MKFIPQFLFLATITVIGCQAPSSDLPEVKPKVDEPGDSQLKTEDGDAEADAKTQEVAEAAKREAEAAKRRAEENAQATEDQLSAAEKARQEAEAAQAEAERAKEEAERARQEAEQRAEDAQEELSEAEKARREADLAKAEAEKAKVDAERAKREAEEAAKQQQENSQTAVNIFGFDPGNELGTYVKAKVDGSGPYVCSLNGKAGTWSFDYGCLVVGETPSKTGYKEIMLVRYNVSTNTYASPNPSLATYLVWVSNPQGANNNFSTSAFNADRRPCRYANNPELVGFTTGGYCYWKEPQDGGTFQDFYTPNFEVLTLRN